MVSFNDDANDEVVPKEKKTTKHETLHYNASHANIDAVKRLLESGMDVNGKDERKEETPLMAAALGEMRNTDDFGNVNILCSIIELLCANGADVEAKDVNEDSALIKCAKYGCKHTTKTLLAKGASVNAAGRDNFTALTWAARYGHSDTLVILLQNGADMTAVDSVHHYTPLIYAAFEGHTSSVRLLLENGSDVNATGSDGFTAMIWAARKGHTSVVQVLADNGSDVKAVNIDQNAAIHGAAGKGHDSVISILIENGADINAKGKDEQTPLIHAARKGFYSTAELLITAGASKEATDSAGRNALWHCQFQSDRSDPNKFYRNQDVNEMLVTLLSEGQASSATAVAPFKDGTDVATEEISDFVFTGLLFKKKRKTRGFAQRFYKLDKQGILSERTHVDSELPNKTHNICGPARPGMMSTQTSRQLTGDTSGFDTPRSKSKDKFPFQVTVQSANGNQKQLSLYAFSDQERQSWIASINKTQSNAKNAMSRDKSFWQTKAQGSEVKMLSTVPLFESASFHRKVGGDEVPTEIIEFEAPEGRLGLRFMIENDEIVVSQVHDGPAKDVGLLMGDVLTQINGEDIPVPEETDEFEKYFKSVAKPCKMTVARRGTINVVTFDKRPFGLECIIEGYFIRIINVVQDQEGHRAGVCAGDIIILVDNESYVVPDSVYDFQESIEKRPLPITFTLKSFTSPPANKDAGSRAVDASSPAEAVDLKPMGAEGHNVPAATSIQPSAEEHDVPAATSIQPQAANEPHDQKDADTASASNASTIKYVVKTLQADTSNASVMYAFEITNSSSGNTVTISQRYSLFYKLRMDLIQSPWSNFNGPIELIPFPPKTFFRSSSFSPDVIKSRTVGLQKWFEEVLNLPTEENSETVQSLVMNFLITSQGTA